MTLPKGCCNVIVWREEPFDVPLLEGRGGGGGGVGGSGKGSAFDGSNGGSTQQHSSDGSLNWILIGSNESTVWKYVADDCIKLHHLAEWI